MHISPDLPPVLRIDGELKKTRYETIDLTAEGLDARTESGYELREMRAKEVMADVDPELPGDI